MEFVINIEEYEIYEADCSIENIPKFVMEKLKECFTSEWTIELFHASSDNKHGNRAFYKMVKNDNELEYITFSLPYFSFNSDEPLYPQLKTYMNNLENSINESLNEEIEDAKVKINLLHNLKNYIDFDERGMKASDDEEQQQEQQQENFISSRSASLKMNEIRRKLKDKISSTSSSSPTIPTCSHSIEIPPNIDIIERKSLPFYCLDISKTSLASFLLYYFEESGYFPPELEEEDVHPILHSVEINNVMFSYYYPPPIPYISYFVNNEPNESYTILYNYEKETVYLLCHLISNTIYTLKYENDAASEIVSELMFIEENDENEGGEFVKCYERIDGRYEDLAIDEIEIEKYKVL